MKPKYDIPWLIEQSESGKPLKYLYFWGHTQKPNLGITKACFSQWYESSFEVNGINFPSAEHWMMAQKALLFEDQIRYEKIIACESPAEAKQLGREVRKFDENIWKEHRYEIVVTGNIHKFSQDKEFGAFLLNSKKRVIVEASPVDTIWGIGLSTDSKDITNIYAWRGLNLLGFALMEVRDALRENGFSEHKT